MDLRDLEVNPDAVEEGIWVRIVGEWRWLIRHKNSSAFRDKLEELMEPYSAMFAVPPERRPTKTNELYNDLVIEAVIDTIVVDWEPITMDGKPFPCTLENRKQVMTSPKTAYTLGRVMEVITETDNYLGKATVGKSESGSTGSSSSETA